MCGRSAVSLNKPELQSACSYKPKESNVYVKPDWLPEHNDGKDYTPSYNIAPTDITPVLLSSTKYKNATKSDRLLKPMMWGIIPPWHKGNYKNHNLSTNNCRLENITNSKLYTPILNNGGRCVIVVDGYYEWQTTNKASKVKQPYYLYAQQRAEFKIDDPSTWDNTYDEENGWRGITLLYMAGLYNIWQSEDVIIYSYSIITMESNNTLSWLHHRMPAILETQELIEAWLDVDKVPPNVAISLLNPNISLCWHKVSTLVNNSKYKGSDCNKKLQEKQNTEIQKTLTSWLTKSAKRQNENCSTMPAKKNKY